MSYSSFVCYFLMMLIPLDAAQQLAVICHHRQPPFPLSTDGGGSGRCAGF